MRKFKYYSDEELSNMIGVHCDYIGWTATINQGEIERSNGRYYIGIYKANTIKIRPIVKRKFKES